MNHRTFSTKICKKWMLRPFRESCSVRASGLLSCCISPPGTMILWEMCEKLRGNFLFNWEEKYLMLAPDATITLPLKDLLESLWSYLLPLTAISPNMPARRHVEELRGDRYPPPPIWYWKALHLAIGGASKHAPASAGSPGQGPEVRGFGQGASTLFWGIKESSVIPD